ncbi:MAG TPA: hypothetical protein VM934_06540 [Pyrinomonadaceae bacterium]|jgi:hypothetical protein|nr:hypothetical protein [Pyrinomonadaceae bacterium]
MNQARWKNRLEVATNMAVLFVAVIVLATFVRSYLGSHPKPQLEAGFQKGQPFARVPGINYNSASQTLLIAMSTKCRYCNESVPFYKQLAEAQRASGKATHIVAVFPNAEGEVKQYLQQNNLNLETITDIDLKALNINGTPSAVLIDSSGKVSDFWIGKLPQDIQQRVIKAASE